MLPLLFLLQLARLSANPLEDLASPDQKVRDAAATELVESFTPIPVSKWDSLVAKLPKDLPETEMIQVLEAAGAKAMPSGGSGPFLIRDFSLDQEWAISCFITPKERTLDHVSVRPDIKLVYREPAKDFTGVWICYYANGKKGEEVHFEKGVRSGAFRRWTADGVLSLEGDYRDDKQVGVWKDYGSQGELIHTYEPKE